MKQVILSLLIIIGVNSASAQGKFGYLSYEQALRALPSWTTAQAQIDTLSAQYNAEMKRAADEFNLKYESFLEEQKTLASAIRVKRQAELQEMMEKNLAFKQIARELLDEAREKAFQPVHQKLSDLLERIGQERGYLFIVNTDVNAFPWIDKVQGEDIQSVVEQMAKTAK